MKIFAINSDAKSWLVAAETPDEAKKLLPKGVAAKDIWAIDESFTGESGLLGSAGAKFVRQDRVLA